MLPIRNPSNIRTESPELLPCELMTSMCELPSAPPTSRRPLKATEGISAAMFANDFPVGMIPNTSAVSARLWEALWTSTTGASPLTVMVSFKPPTARSALTVAVKFANTSTFVRTTVVKPASVNDTVYRPSGSATTRYCPDWSLTAERVFSISAGLATSMVTPGRTPAEASRATPAMTPCACARTGITANTIGSSALRSTLMAPRM